ncbi:MAG: glucosamine-6-phosphate isomerase [Ruminococcaceae bacterium]|nr:glucosamine-6-phosphate isomerase [Oscillospiraceae bacterium]
MKSTYTCSSADFLKNSKIPTRVMTDEAAMYEEIAELMASTIEQNNAKGEKTVIICPVGPIAQYPILADKINKRNISLKDCWFINMDEYLDENDCAIDYGDPLSFHASMDKMLYSRVKTSLLMPKEQRLFPEPQKEAEIDELFEKLGKVDLCLTGVGINGHIAFNESAKPEDNITDEEYKNIGTRKLNIATETIVNNGANKIFGALDIFPRRCITLGMKQLLKAKTIKVYLYCRWQWGIMRKIGLEDESRFMPASFLQSHPNAEMVITEELLNMKL